MVKRESAGTVDVDAPRPKRRKDSSAAPKSEDVEMADAGASSDVEASDDKKAEDVSRTPEEISEIGLKAWLVVKDASAKDGRQLAPVFMRLPSKRQYPDYYDVIKQPIALEDIKARLDGNKYSSLDDVRQDFELCFKNARRYNVRESQIWRDAKSLQKLMNKEIDKIIRPEGDEEGSDEEGGKKKKGKGSNVNRLMKNRLQKLITMTDPTGRSLSSVFMDLPSRKKWPLYYKIIKRPICFEDIFKRIKRKEYATVQDFMADVDLVFQNAMTFNEDGSPVNDDARQLKQHFAQIMKDIPSQLGQASSEQPTVGKIMLKLPNPHAASSHPQDHPVAGPSHSGQIHLLPPATNANVENTVVDVLGASDIGGKKGKSPALAHATLPSSNSITVPHRRTQISPKGAQNVATAGLNALAQAAASKAVPATPQAQIAPAQPVQISQTQATYYAGTQMTTTFHQTPGAYVPPSTPTPIPSRMTSAIPGIPGIGVGTTPADSTVAPAISTAASSSTSAVLPGAVAAASTPPPGPQFRSVHLTTLPLGRCISLDHDEGVRSWMLRLGSAESKVVLSSVEFLRDDEDEELEAEEEEGATNGSGAKADEDTGKPEEEEEEEEEDHAQESAAAAPVTVAPLKRKRGRGRPAKAKPAQPNGVDKDKENKAKALAAKNRTLRRSQRGSGSTIKSGIQPTIEDVLVKLNGVQLSSRSHDATSTLTAAEESKQGEWDIEVTSGSHVLEVTQKSRGSAWKVYIERRA